MAKPLKILQMCAVDFTVRQFLLPLVDALKAEGHEVHIACAPGPYFPELQAKGYELRPNPIDRSLNVWHHLIETWRTWGLICREKYDVVHVHTPVASLVGRLAARLSGTPVIVYTAHGFYFHDEMPKLKKSLFVSLEKFGAWCGHRILCVSDEDRRAAINLGISRPEAIETIYNGIDPAHFHPQRFTPDQRRQLRRQYGIPEEAVVVGVVGRMVREKGFLELAEAAGQLKAQFPKLHLLLVGDELPSDHDGVKQTLKNRLNELGLQTCSHFPGLVPDPAPLLACMDIFTLPSYREGMPISLLEAMAMGLPCVTTDVRGCREEVVDGISGWIVPSRSSESLAQALSQVLEHPGEAKRRGIAARERVLEQFHLEKIVQRQIGIYRDLLAQRARR
jgi:glycosyltransferase involved in cell wall biosynthesis